MKWKSISNVFCCVYVHSYPLHSFPSHILLAPTRSHCTDGEKVRWIASDSKNCIGLLVCSTHLSLGHDEILLWMKRLRARSKWTIQTYEFCVQRIGWLHTPSFVQFSQEMFPCSSSCKIMLNFRANQPKYSSDAKKTVMKIWRVKITLLAIVEGFHSRSFFSSSFQFLLDTRGRLIYAFFFLNGIQAKCAAHEEWSETYKLKTSFPTLK